MYIAYAFWLSTRGRPVVEAVGDMEYVHKLRAHDFGSGPPPPKFSHRCSASGIFENFFSVKLNCDMKFWLKIWKLQIWLNNEILFEIVIQVHVTQGSHNKSSDSYCLLTSSMLPICDTWFPPLLSSKRNHNLPKTLNIRIRYVISVLGWWALVAHKSH